MSPRRLDPSVVESRLRTMSALLDDLATVPAEADLTSDRMAGDRLQRTARTYRDSFLPAAECGLIDDALRDELVLSVGLRSVLVHEYLEVDLDQVRAAIPLALNGYRRYVRQAAAFVAGLPG